MTARRTAPGIPLRCVARSEWTKLRTSRGAVLTALAAAITTLVLTALHCASAPRGPIDAVGASLFGITVAQFIAAVCGALAVTSEYGSTTMRITLLATPRRHRLFAAKTMLLVAAAAGYGLLVTGASVGVGRILLAGSGGELTPNALRRVAGAAAVLVAMALIGFACGFLVRHSAGALVATLAVLILPRLLTGALPAADRAHVLRYTPLSAADSLVSLRAPDVLGPLAGLAVLIAEVAVLLVCALTTFDRRDA